MKQSRRHEEFSVWRRGTKGIINGHVELAIDSFDVLHAGLRLSHPSRVCGRVNSGYPAERRSLTGEWILRQM